MATLSPQIEDYLKAIYRIQLQGGRAGTNRLAEQMDVTAASATNMLKRLAELKMVRYTPYRGVELTTAGRKIALEILRHHRLMELYLTEILGMSWDQVHDEADRLEHVISEEFEERVAEALGHPAVDPHGDPIPTKELAITETDYPTLAELEAGEWGEVARVTDGDPELLRYLAELGLYPGTSVSVREKGPFEGPIVVEVSGTEHSVGRELARNVFVKVTEVSQR